MVSLREATQIAEFPDPVISLRRLAHPYGLGPSLSLQELIGELDPEQITFKTGEIKAGDVKGWGELTVLSNGYWIFRGHLHDSGTIVGDHYRFVMALKHVDDSGEALAVNQQGTLGAIVGGSRNADWEQKGRDPKLAAANWHDIVSQGATYTLKVDPDLKKLAGVIGEFVLTLGAIGLYFLTAGNAKNCRREIDPVTGNEVIRCPVAEW